MTMMKPTDPRVVHGLNEDAERALSKRHGLTNETAWWQPRAGKKLKDLSTPELNALAAGMQRCIEPAFDNKADDLLTKIKAELEERGNPLVTR